MPSETERRIGNMLNTNASGNTGGSSSRDFSGDFFRQEEIRLIARGGDPQQEGVRFFVTPELNESRATNYHEISDIRQAGGILIYIGTTPRTYQLNARMVSRTTEEADRTFRYTHLLKSWGMPTKGGRGSGGEDQENSPEVLKLWGYGQERQLRGVPVVLTSLSIDYPANITYIQASNGAFVPIIQNFGISLKEARSVGELDEFKLGDYKQGILPNW